MKKPRKRKTIKSRLSDLPISELNWRDYLLELLFLGALVDKKEGLDALNTFQELLSAVARISERPFDGSVSAWNLMAVEAGDGISQLVKAVPDFFCGATDALFRRLPLEGREQVLTLTTESENGIENDFLAIARLVGTMGDRRGKTATRAKALHLWALLSRPKYSAASWDRTRVEIKGVLDGSIPNGFTTLRATWLPIVAEELTPSVQWAIDFWSFGMDTPCLREPYDKPTKAPWPVGSLVPIVTQLDSLMADVLARAGPSLDFPVYDVLGGLLGRVRGLLQFVLASCGRDEGEAAEIFLRCLADTNITIRWMLKQEDRTIFLKYKERSYEQEKHAIETLRSAIGETVPDETKRAVDQEYSKLHKTSGRWPELMDVTLGPWNDLSIAQMAKELGPADEDKYTLVFGRASEAVHGSWRNLTRFHLDECVNPLHNGHYLPADNLPRSAGVTPAVGALLLASEALLETLIIIAPPDADERNRADAIMERLTKWIGEHHSTDPSTGPWRIENVDSIEQE